MVFTQLVANSLIIGSIYALVAVGFSIIYSTNKFMHFAHGVFISIAAYLLFAFFRLLHFVFPAAVILTLLVTSVLGVLSYRLLYLPLQRKKSSNVILLIGSVGLLILVENLILLIFGADVKSINLIQTARGLEILDAFVTPLQIFIFLTSAVLLILLYLFMEKTRLGRNMRAVADNKELADIIGINHERIADFSFLLGSFLAGAAGILIGLEQSITPTMGTWLIIKGFTGTVIGGITSVPGSIIGSYILGFAENFGVWFLPSQYKEAIAFILMFLFLLFRPKGLFGKGERR